MTKRIFRAIFYVSMLVLLASALILMAFVGEYNQKNQQKTLQTDAVYIMHALQEEGISYLETLPKGEERITWIAADGTVLYDSQVDAAQLESHADREEFVEAQENGTGNSVRYSSTLAEKTYYYAAKMQDNSVLRVSLTSLSMLSMFFTILQPLAIIIAIALVLAGFLASKTSKSIIKPLENVDLEHPEQSEIYDELSPFLRRIAVQQRMIGNQIHEQQYKQREFQTITENMQEGLLVLDAKGEVLSCNKGALRIFGMECVAEKENVYNFNRSEAFRYCIQEALGGRHAESVMEQEGKTYHLLANPVMEDALVAGVVLLVFDHTEKADREKLRREFTANVSHELKTPLTSISGFAEIMKNGMVKSEDIPRFATNIYEEAQRLISMVQDIIQLSRLDEAEETAQKTDVDIANIVEDVVKRLESFAQQHEVTLQATCDKAIVRGIPHVLEEMFYNLCDNAIRYNKPNGTVQVEVQNTANEICVSVSDTGMGIPYAEQDRVFERFYRVSRSRSKEIDGTGLGLSIVKHGAQLHHATVEMKSEVEQGTTITLHFPKEA